MARPQEFNQTEVLRAAMAAFWQKGYEATSLSDLLAATGLSKSSLYASFGNKHDLMIAALDLYRQDRFVEMKNILLVTPARKGIEAFFRKIIEDAGTPGLCNGCMSINQVVELGPTDPEVRERIAHDFQQFENAMATAVKKGREDGSIAQTDQSAEDIAKLLTLAFPGFQVMARTGTNTAWFESTLDQLLSVLDG